jgi:hypothetical protein
MGIGDAVDKIVESALPAGLGGVYELYMGAPARRREETWKAYIHDTVVDLAHRYNSLDEDPIFIDALFRTTRIALATHQAEKLEALRNALANSVGPNAPDVDKQAIFLRFVEEFRPAHIRLLGYLDSPGSARLQLFESWRRSEPADKTVTTERILDFWLPETAGNQELLGWLAEDLAVARLIPQKVDLEEITTQKGVNKRRTTKLGQEFLWFVKSRG